MPVLRRQQAMQFVELKSSAFDELRHQLGFPRPAYLSPRCPVWREAELQAWLDAKFANREGGEA